MLTPFHLRLKISLDLISMDTSLHPGSTRPLESAKSPVLVHIFAFQCPSTAKWLHFGIQNERIVKPNEACYAITFKCFAWRRIISKQIWPDSTEESFINTLYKTIFTKTDTSVQITVLQSVGVRSINRWGDKYLALGDWKRFHHLSFLQQSAATDNSPSSIVTYIVRCFSKADFFPVPLICWGNLISNLTHLTFHGLSSRGNHVDKDFQL